MACRAAAERMPAAEVQELRRVLEAHERDEAFQAGLGYYQQEGDYDFHYRIVKGSGNQMLFRMLCDELYQLARMYRIQYSTTPNRPGSPLPNTTAFSTPLPTAMASWLELLMRRHIRASRLNIEQQIAQATSGVPRHDEQILSQAPAGAAWTTLMRAPPSRPSRPAPDGLPYTSRVLAENLVRRCEPSQLTDALKQLIERRRDLDFPGIRRAWSVMTSWARPRWSIWPACATPSPTRAAIRQIPTRWCRYS